MSEILHNRFHPSLGTWINILSLRLFVTSCDLNTSVHSEYHIFPIDTRALCVKLGMMWYSHALSGNQQTAPRSELFVGYSQQTAPT